MFDITKFSLDFLTGHPVLTVLFLIVFAALAVYLYRRTNPPLSVKVRLLLTALRLVAIAAVFLALLEPVVSYQREYERPPRLTLLIDHSGSMDVEENGMSRFKRVDSLLQSSEMSALLRNFDVTTRYFAAGVNPGPDVADPHQTALGEALRQTARDELAEPAEYWLVLSDGVSNSGVAPQDVAVTLKTPVYTVGFGSQGMERDLAVTGVDYNQVAFAGKPTEITVHLEWSGMDNDHAPIQVQAGEKTLATSSLRLPPGGLQKDTTIQFIPERPGRQTFRVTVPPLADEVSTDNNGRSFSMVVLKSRLNVLLVADRLDWEFAFLNRFLERAENVDVTPVVFKNDGTYIMGRFPSRQEELNQYDLVMLYDVTIPSLRARSDLFESFLAERGGGLCVMLGDNYLKAPFERWLDRFLPFVSRGHRAEPIRFTFSGLPAENFLFHPAVRIADTRQEIRERWKEMPHFEMLIPADSVTPNSDVLVTADLRRDLQHLPVLGYRRYGAGKVLASTVAPFWHWAFYGYGFGEEVDEYPRLFDGIVNWLSLKEDYDPIRVVPDKTVYTRGEQVGFTAFVYDLGFRPIAQATGYVALVAEGTTDTSLVQWTEQGEGRYALNFDVVAPGRYLYTGVVEKDGKTLKTTEGQIVVENYYIEDFRRRPDFAALTTVSQLSGGRFYASDHVSELAQYLDTQPIRVTIRTEIVIWNKFWLLSVFILVLGLEWLIRKRFQLI
ncbi:MAG: hypothetical protein JW763_08300 [candidate division Zixibacteria bacterium]|nr:hypothetical protein [candidate division Zixibacteria bacterium]